MWIPNIRGNHENIMATSANSLKIYQINNETNSAYLKADLKTVFI